MRLKTDEIQDKMRLKTDEVQDGRGSRRVSLANVDVRICGSEILARLQPHRPHC